MSDERDPDDQLDAMEKQGDRSEKAIVDDSDGDDDADRDQDDEDDENDSIIP